MTDVNGLIELLRREATSFENETGVDIEADAGTAKLLREAATALSTQQAPGTIDATTFIEWLRPWAKNRFGVWITHNTAKGAYNAFLTALQSIEAGGGEV